MATNIKIPKSPLLAGISDTELEAMLPCLGARLHTYEDGEQIYRMGDVVKSLGLVVSGAVIVENVDAWGNISVVGRVGAGGVFAEVYAALPNEPLMVDVIAEGETEVLFLDVSKVVNGCEKSCVRHDRISANLNTVMARKNLSLSRKTFNVAPKSIRGKVLAYLSYEAKAAGSDEFDIPFDRQQLADYLGVDRSALSAELSRMKKDGLIDTHKSHFVLYGTIL